MAKNPDEVAPLTPATPLAPSITTVPADTVTPMHLVVASNNRSWTVLSDDGIELGRVVVTDGGGRRARRTMYWAYSALQQKHERFDWGVHVTLQTALDAILRRYQNADAQQASRVSAEAVDKRARGPYRHE